jgi:predicted ATPase
MSSRDYNTDMDVKGTNSAAIRNSNIYVFTGGPGSGKTTVLAELQRRGFPVIREVARQIIQEQVAIGGNALPWGDRERYTELMLERSIESFLAHRPSAAATFADRGIPDTWGYATLIDLPRRAHIWDACERYRYAPLVFTAPFWEEIYVTDTERKQTMDEAERTALFTVEVYQKCGYDVVVLPKDTPQARADFVLARLDLKPSS